jgi:anti-sigma-K factor RskA
VNERKDLRELVGSEVPEQELERLRRVDALLRRVPAPPEVPHRLLRAVTSAVEPQPRRWTSRRLAAALAFVVALAALSFALGTQVADEGFDERATVEMRATAAGEGASALLRLGESDEHGNWRLRLEASGLPPLPEGGYYVLWLAKDGDYGATCGTFAVGEGTTEAEWSVSYRLREYDAWVVTAYVPGRGARAEPPWLLQADV